MRAITGFPLKRIQTTKSVLGDLFPDLPWYGYWLQDQLRLQPSSMFEALMEFDCRSEERLANTFLPLCKKLSCIVKETDGASIAGIVDVLSGDGIFIARGDDDISESAISLVFAILGWLTMLYRPDILSCSPAEFCIMDEMDGHRGDGHMGLKQDRRASRKNLRRFLLGFGLMVPQANYNAFEEEGKIRLFDKLTSVEPSTLNAFLLTTIGGLSIEWTDSLACHLELDKVGKTVYLSRYPSFCLSNLKGSGADTGILRACGSKPSDRLLWGSDQDVSQLLEEVLLSYRLLFGQDKRSRRLFHKLNPFLDTPSNSRDELLSQLCSAKDLDGSLGLSQHDAYELAKDFPHIRTKLVRLSNHLTQRRPRSWAELWVDNRDSASWLTFWAVIIIGAVGLFLAFIQVVLQAVQVAFQLQHPGS
ncbi:hypothetical protein F5Y17DRAFT_406605 [Xylariaceae sp. FL0594]|nr:hypothetical protein F5Y17DRAFT_406605 [Xylariaceae sp. FL0594]